jgi:hypothetical protein
MFKKKKRKQSSHTKLFFREAFIRDDALVFFHWWSQLKK